MRRNPSYREIHRIWQRRQQAGGRCVVLCRDSQQALQLSDIFRHWQSAAAYLDGEPLWRDYRALSGERHIADEWLGLECDGLRLALEPSLTANGFAAACGALRWGGVLMLYPGPASNGFCDYLLSRVQQSTAVMQLCELEPGARAALDAETFDKDAGRDQLAISIGWRHRALEQQSLVVDRLERLLSGHRHRPFLLSARRGRGKSSALGEAAARWCQSGAHVVVLSPSLSNINALIDRFEALGGRCVKSNHWQLGEGILQWKPMDRYLDGMQAHGRGEGDCLVIDEAAAFSFRQLESCLGHPRVAMATTLEGYEGSGRGFRIRFLNWLTQRWPKWRQLELLHPIRWSDQDELEPLLDDWLLLRASEMIAETGAQTDTIDRQNARAVCLTGAERRNVTLAAPVMGLLQQAHHRNSPNDFQALLEASDQQFWCLKHDSRVQAAAVLIEEPVVEAPLLEAIRAGERRLAGQLLRQSLAFYCQNCTLSALPGGRIQRIATAMELRREGRASMLLRTIEDQARQQGQAWIGTSFPAESGLIRFWRANGYRLIRLGLQLDRITGLPSVLALKVLQPGLEDELTALQQQFNRRLFHGLSRQWRHLNPDAVRALWPDHIADPQHSDTNTAVAETEILRRFVDGGGELALWETEILALLSRSPLPESGADARVLIAAIFQNRSAASLGFNGKKVLHGRLRHVLKPYCLAN